MNLGSVLLGTLVILLYGFVLLGLPVMWAAWRRQRRAAIVSRQIALTDALDAALGPILTPVVARHLHGPWQVRIAVPLMGAESMGRIVATTDAVLTAAEFGAAPYQLVLTPLPHRAHTPRRISREQPGRPAAFAA